jgi:HK97 family phage prohead protease
MGDLEYRNSFETRAKDDGAGLIGHSSTFWVVDSYYTAIAPGAFQKSLTERGDKIPLLYQHDPSINIGIPEVQREDEKGLYIEAAIFDDGADGTTLTRRLRAGARYGLSFGFRTILDRSATEEDPLDFTYMPHVNRSEIRVLVENKLYEHSVVTFPANETAEIQSIRQRARADALNSLIDDLRENRLTDDERQLMQRVVAAFPSAPASTSEPRDQRSARRLDAELALAQYRYLTPEYLTG